MAIREGRWDCPSCGCIGQLGRDTRCTQCGDRRPEGIRFYLPENEGEVDAARLAQARAGADWVCEHCGGSSRASDAACSGCGAPRGSSPAQQTREYGMDEVPRSGAGAPPPIQPLAGAGGGQQGKKKGGMGCGGCLTVILALVGGTMWLGRPRNVETVVQGRQWERTVQVEANRLVTESDWSLPGEGQLIRQYRDVRDHRQVLDHYESRTRQVSERVQTGTRTYTCGQRDMGNGYFEDVTCTEPEYETRYHDESYQEPVYRQEPIYDTKYEYRIWRWQPDTLLAARDTGEAMRWPAVRLRERQREGARTARYVVTLADAKKKKTYTIEVDSARFTRLRPGQSTLLRVRGEKAELLDRPAEAPDTAAGR
jgi:hypothetical protein